jgi:hypothetical protein
MQQTKSYWRMVAVAGVVGACLASACVVTTSTDDGLGGGTSTAGATTGTAGASTVGGSAGSGGSTAIAGTGGAPAGGTGSTVVGCDMGDADAMTGTPAANCNATAGDACSACLQTSCCTALEVCNGTNPNNQCAFGGPGGAGEFSCVAACMKMAFATNGVEQPDDLPTCAGQCNTDACGTVIGTSTSNLIACVHGDGTTDGPCTAACFQ